MNDEIPMKVRDFLVRTLAHSPRDKFGALSLSKRQIRLKRTLSEPIVANF